MPTPQGTARTRLWCHSLWAEVAGKESQSHWEALGATCDQHLLLLLEFRVSHSKLQARGLDPLQLNSDMSCEPRATATCPCVTRDSSPLR